MEKVTIEINVSDTVGDIPPDVTGIMPDPPRPAEYNEYLTQLGEAGSAEGVAFHAEGANAPWIQVLKPSFTNLGWGGDTWCRFHTWPAEGEYNWERPDAWVENYRDLGVTNLSMVFSWIPEWLWSENEYAHESANAAGAWFPYMKQGHALPPSSWEKYEEIVYQTVRHLNVEKNYGIKFTTWNEPNVRFWLGTQEEWLELCGRSARAVKRADPNTMVGGPASAGFAPDWIEAYVKYFAENEHPIDFVSWHYYLFYAKKRGNVMSFTEQANTIRDILKKYPGFGEPKLYVTEWAYDWKASDASPTFNGAFVAQSLYEMIEGGVDGATYCGLLGFIDAPDPAVQAYFFYNQLEEQRIPAEVAEANATVGALATRNGARTAVLVWDFAHEGDARAEKSNAVSLHLAGLAPGRYRLRRQLVDADHLGPEAAFVDERIIDSDRDVTLDFELQPYGLSLIELTPK